MPISLKNLRFWGSSSTRREANSQAWPMPCTTVPLTDLGAVRHEWQGILSPVYNDELIESFIQRQFLVDASVYTRKYQDTEHWKELLLISRRHYRIAQSRPLILDIGSGAGNTIFPLMELYPQARLVASDLSVPLLQILKDYLEQRDLSSRCRVMQLNAEALIFEPNQFDLIVGGSILHHLFSPEKTVAESYRVLKPGGVAVFFEPFELGNQVLALIFEQLIDLNRNPPDGIAIEPAVVQFLEAIRFDLRVRKGYDKSASHFKHMDDKWLFTRSYFEQEGYRAGFRKVKVIPRNPSEDNHTPFTQQTAVLLRLGLQKELQALPDWAKQRLALADDHFSREILPELMIEGIVVMQK